MSNIDYSTLSRTTKDLILHTARDLTFGRFLAGSSPSFCKEVFDSDFALSGTFHREAQIFCEQVCRLCKYSKDGRERKFLLRGQSPDCWSRPIDLYRSDSREVTARLYSYMMGSLFPTPRTYPIEPRSEIICRIVDTPFVLTFYLHCGTGGEYATFLLKTGTKLAPVALFYSLALASLVGFMHDMEFANVRRWINASEEDGLVINGYFPIEKVEDLPFSNGPSEEERNIVLWREDIYKKIIRVFQEPSLGFSLERVK